MATSGPLPNPKRRRTNPPTIPTTNLPAAGRSGPAPRPPKAAKLGPAGAAWWKWAWKTPQAAAWDAGALYALARRASLEDDLAAIEQLDSQPLALNELLGLEYTEVVSAVEVVIATLKRLSVSKLTILREARELDDRFGLTPKALAAMRWSIVADAPADTADSVDKDDEVTRRRERKARLAAGA